MTATFKICNMCTRHYQKPLGLNRRKCPTCKANTFRAPTCEEIKAIQDQNDRMQALIDSLAEDA